MDDQLLATLMFRSEDPSVDYKADQYVFSRNDQTDDGLPKQDKAMRFEEKKSELLKDILAMSNGWSEGPAYILLGFREDKPRPPQVVGLNQEKTYDDAAFQQFVGSKVNRPLDFKYEVREFRGVTIGVLTIPKQRRPFFSKETYGGVAKGIVYVRRGSSTAIADPDEIAAMGAEPQNRAGPAQVEVELLDVEGHSLVSSVQKVRVPRFPDSALPDYSETFSGPFGSLARPGVHINSAYWRDLAKWVTTKFQAVPIQIRISNRSSFALNHSEMHITALQGGLPVAIQFGNNKPRVPSTQHDFLHRGLRHTFEKPKLLIKESNSEMTALATFDKVLPGATQTLDESFSLMPSESGNILLRCTLYASELPAPIVFEVCLEVEVVMEAWDLQKIKKLDVELSSQLQG